jgi:hypothetical protein
MLQEVAAHTKSEVAPALTAGLRSQRRRDAGIIRRRHSNFSPALALVLFLSVTRSLTNVMRFIQIEWKPKPPRVISSMAAYLQGAGSDRNLKRSLLSPQAGYDLSLRGSKAARSLGLEAALR